ncbi:MAG TPA: BatA and WFA domain-containing protein, partial [Bacteroidales bacterium]|nr:BatA and WFA domain-containing protein [Bacteroidales bacterium]
MHFVNPYFLFVFFALGIPIIVHLFNFRKFRKVWFTNVKLLEEFTQQTRKESKIKHLLTLILRLLALSCLILAFAQPYIKSYNKGFSIASSAISIYIDNSFSMESAAGEGTLIDEAKKRAIEIAMSFKTSDLFNIITNDFEGKHQRFVTRDEFIELINDIRTSSSVRSLSEILQRENELFKNIDKPINKFIFLISDFQKSICDFENLAADTSINLFAITLTPTVISNVYIDTAWLNSPVIQAGQNNVITVKIVNTSSSDLEKIPLKLSINGTQKAIASIDIKAKGETEVNLPFTINDENRIQHGYIEITDYPVNYDDKLFFAFSVNKNISVLNIYGKNITKNYIKSLFNNDSLVTYIEYPENMIDYSSFPNFNLIILNGLQQFSSGLSQELKKFLSKGGSIAIFPSFQADLNSYNTFLSYLGINDKFSATDTIDTKVASINLQHPFFKDVFDKIPENINLPIVYEHYSLTKNITSKSDILLALQNNESFLSVYPYMSGKVYLFTIPLELSYSNLPKHALFVPTLYRMALLVEPERSLYYFTCQDNVIPLKA